MRLVEPPLRTWARLASIVAPKTRNRCRKNDDGNAALSLIIQRPLSIQDKLISSGCFDSKWGKCFGGRPRKGSQGGDERR